MIRHRRNKEQIKEMVVRAAIGMAALFFLILMIGLAGTKSQTKDQEIKETVAATPKMDKKEEKAQEKKVEIPKMEVEVTVGEIIAVQEVIKNDVYGEQLKVIYDQQPELKKLLLNREQYPDWLIEYLVGHEEAVQWVVDYPEYMAQDPAQIEEEAMAPIDLSDCEMRNGIPLYYQWDQNWGYASYGSGQIATDGCGVTCLSMVAAGLLEDLGMTPKKLADYSDEKGYFSEESGTSWGLMQEGAGSLGLTVIDVEWSVAAIYNQLENGNVIICSMGAGDFTEQGHFIVLCGLNEEGQAIVNDPNSEINSRKAWEIQDLLDQMKAMWAYQRPQ